MNPKENPQDTLRKKITKEANKVKSPSRKSKVLPSVHMRSSSTLEANDLLPRDVSHRFDSSQRSRSSFETMESKLREILGIPLKTESLPSTLPDLSQYLQKSDPIQSSRLSEDIKKFPKKEKLLEKVLQEGGLLYRTQSGLLQPQLCRLYDQVVQKNNGLRSELPRAGVELGVPSSRKEVEVLIAWLEQMSKTYLEDPALPVEEKVRRAQLIYTACFKEVVRQVSVQCVERGVLIQRVWNASVDLNSLCEEERKKQVKIMKEKVQDVVQETLNELRNRCEKAEKTVEELRKVIREKDLESSNNSPSVQVEMDQIKIAGLQVDVKKNKRVTGFVRKKISVESQTSFDKNEYLTQGLVEVSPKKFTVLVGYFDENGMFFKQQAFQKTEENVENKNFFNEITEISKKVDVEIMTDQQEVEKKQEKMKEVVFYVKVQHVSTQFPEFKQVLKICKLFGNKISVKPSQPLIPEVLDEESLSKVKNLDFSDNLLKPEESENLEEKILVKKVVKKGKKSLKNKSKGVSPAKSKKALGKTGWIDHEKGKRENVSNEDDFNQKGLIQNRSKSQLKNPHQSNKEKQDQLRSSLLSTPTPALPKEKESIQKNTLIKSSQNLVKVASPDIKPPTYPNIPEKNSNQVNPSTNPMFYHQPSDIATPNSPKVKSPREVFPEESPSKPAADFSSLKEKPLKSSRSLTSPLLNPTQVISQKIPDKPSNQKPESKEPKPSNTIKKDFLKPEEDEKIQKPSKTIKKDILKPEEEEKIQNPSNSPSKPPKNRNSIENLSEKSCQTQFDLFPIQGLSKSEIISLIHQLNKLLKDLQADKRRKIDLQKDQRAAERAGKLIMSLKNLFIEKNPKKNSRFSEISKSRIETEGISSENPHSQDSQRLKKLGKTVIFDSNKPSTQIDEFNLGIIHKKNILDHPGQKLFLQVLQSVPISVQASISLKVLIKIINSVHSEKRSLCKENPTYYKYEACMILYDFFINKYGLKSVSENKFKQVIISTLALKSSNFRVLNFSKFLGIDSNYVAEDWNFYLEIFEILDFNNFGVNLASDLNHFSSLSSILFSVRGFLDRRFQEKDIEEVLNIASGMVEDGKSMKVEMVNTDRFLEKVLQVYDRVKGKVYEMINVEVSRADFVNQQEFFEIVKKVKPQFEGLEKLFEIHSVVKKDEDGKITRLLRLESILNLIIDSNLAI